MLVVALQLGPAAQDGSPADAGRDPSPALLMGPSLRNSVNGILLPGYWFANLSMKLILPGYMTQAVLFPTRRS
jgi:hypothetical protein